MCGRLLCSPSLLLDAAQHSFGHRGLGHLLKLNESRPVSTLGSLLSAVRRLCRARRGGTRGTVVAAGLTLSGMVGKTKSIGGARSGRSSTGSGTGASLRAMRRDGPVARAAAKSAGFLGSQGSYLGTGRAAMALATTQIIVSSVRECHLEVVDVASDAGSHGGVDCCCSGRATGKANG